MMYIIFLLFLFCHGFEAKDKTVVTVTEGKLKGGIGQLLDGTLYYSFKGIPYAQPPKGNLRFRAPVPVKPWKGIYKAIEHGPICPQVDFFSHNISTSSSEDCLFLNIYTKSLKQNSKKPVMVNIHGGAYMLGSGNSDEFGPEILLQHDVILVTINYRLEMFGFLSLETPEVPGNAGMKDQVLALRWVQKNIAYFGGDPDSITIFGESAGSSSVTYHLLSPISKGLFNKAIAQSGVCIQDWSITHNAKERAFRVGKLLGKDTDDVNELLEFLQSVPADSLTNMTYLTRSIDEIHRELLPTYFVPVVERKFVNSEAFISEDPTQLLLQNKVNSVPLMIGFTSSEGMLMNKDQLKDADFLNKNPSYLISRNLAEKISQIKLIEFGQKIKKFYYDGKDFTVNDTQTNINLQTDINFLYNIVRFTDFYSRTNTQIYFYRFDYDTELNIFKKYLNLTEFKGASHADDLFYLFYSNPIKKIYDENENLRKIVYNVSKLWVDFATTGNPTSDNRWPQYTRSNKKYFNINPSWSLGPFVESDRVEFWNKLYCDAGFPYIEDF